MAQWSYKHVVVCHCHGGPPQLSATKQRSLMESHLCRREGPPPHWLAWEHDGWLGPLRWLSVLVIYLLLFCFARESILGSDLWFARARRRWVSPGCCGRWGSCVCRVRGRRAPAPWGVCTPAGCTPRPCTAPPRTGSPRPTLAGRRRPPCCARSCKLVLRGLQIKIKIKTR